MQKLDYAQIIKLAWKEFDGDRHEIKGVFDVSAQVSTNHVYKISFYLREPVFAKLSEYGNFEDFREDHIIYNDGKARGKPFPDLFNNAIRVLGIAKEQITVFEDSTSGIDAANNAGVGNIIIVNSANKNFAQYNHQVIHHFDEVERKNFN